jgi:hypothetical protein
VRALEGRLDKYNYKIYCETGQTGNKLLAQWVPITTARGAGRAASPAQCSRPRLHAEVAGGERTPATPPRSALSNRSSNVTSTHTAQLMMQLLELSTILLKQVPVQVGVADVEPEWPGRGACGGLVDLGCPLGGLL